MLVEQVLVQQKPLNYCLESNIWERRKNLLTEAKLWKKTKAVRKGESDSYAELFERITRITVPKITTELKYHFANPVSSKIGNYTKLDLTGGLQSKKTLWNKFDRNFKEFPLFCPPHELYIYIYIYMCVCVCVCVCVCIHACVCVYVYTYIFPFMDCVKYRCSVSTTL